MFKNKKNNRYIKAPQAPSSLRFKNKMGISLAAIALALGIGSYSLFGKFKDTLTLGITKDILDDNYEKSIPIYSDSNGKKLLTTIGENTLIISEENIEEISSTDKLHLISAIDKKNNIISGYTQKNYLGNLIELKEQDTAFLYKVNSEKGVNLRTSPEVSENKLAGIPQNSILLGGKSNDDEHKWTNVIYFNGGNITKGFVSGNFLQKLENTNNNLMEVMKLNLRQNENKNENKNQIQNLNQDNQNQTKNPSEQEESNVQMLLSPEKNLVCIDVSHMTPKTLDKLLRGELKIPGVAKNIYDIKTNLSAYDRKINCVFFKAAGTTVYSKNLRKGKKTPFKELAEVCEKNNIPFGVYCYSTSTNKQEAELEHKWFSEVIKQLIKYEQFKLPVAIDVEVAGERDRQARVSVKQLTDAKIHLANLLEEDFGKTILYIPRNAYDEKLKSRIFDLNRYQNNLKSGPSHIWHVTPLHNKIHKEALEDTASTEPVTMMQVALDIPITKRRDDILDVNLISKEAFAEYESKKYIFSNFVYGASGKIYFSKKKEQEDKKKAEKLVASNENKKDFER